MAPIDQTTPEKVAFKQHYDTEASRYDRHRYACPCKQMISQLQQEFVLDMFRDAERIFEAGCGTGRFTVPLARQGKRIVALDASPYMLRETYRKAEAAGVAHNIEFVLGDMENLGYKAGAFDGALSIAVLRHFLSPARGIAQIAHVVRPGGTVVIDYLNQHIFRFYEPLRGLFVANPNVPDQYFFRNYYSTFDEIHDYMADNGVNIIQHQGFSKLPSHFLWCQLRLSFLSGLLRLLERKLNFGAVMMIGGKKETGNG